MLPGTNGTGKPSQKTNLGGTNNRKSLQSVKLTEAGPPKQ